MFWFVPSWTLQSVKMITETLFYLFGMGEDSKVTALFKSLVSGPFSIWLPCKLLTYIPAVNTLFTLYDTIFGWIFIPLGLVWGFFGGSTASVGKFATDFTECMNGSSGYYYYGTPSMKGDVTWLG